MTHVFQLLGSLDRGGAEMVALQLSRSIPHEDFQQTYLCTSGREGSLASEFRTTGATVTAMGLRPIGSFVSNYLAAMRTSTPDAVVSHVSLASSWLLVGAQFCGIRTRIARFHSDGDGRKSGVMRRIYRSVSRMVLVMSATHVFAVSESSLHFALGRLRKLYLCRGGEAVVVPNGVDTQKFQFNPAQYAARSEDRLLFVGRASPEKNRQLLMPIWTALLAERPEARFLIVGSDRADDLESDVPDSVRILGDRSDVDVLMRTSSALVLTSTREGLPTVILEALSSGLPVVASDLPGLREIQDRVVGLTLVSTEASPAAWAQHVSEAMEMDAAARSQIRGSFLNSPYTLDQSLSFWRSTWSS